MTKKLETILGALIALALSVGAAYADVGTVTPAGTTSATATTMNAQDVYVSSTTANAGVRLSPKAAGLTQSVTNGTSSPILVYPPTGGNINNTGTDTALVLNANSRMECKAYNNLTLLCVTAGGPTSSNGTVTTVATENATEIGSSFAHRTKIVMTAFALGTTGSSAALAIGNKIYTWPTGTNIEVESATVAGGVTCAVTTTAQTPEVGIGTTIGTGAAATLSTTMENIMDGGASNTIVIDGRATAPDVAGTAFYKTNLSTTRPVIKSSGGAARDVFLNIAATWADAGTGACTFTGNVWLEWKTL